MHKGKAHPGGAQMVQKETSYPPLQKPSGGFSAKMTKIITKLINASLKEQPGG